MEVNKYVYRYAFMNVNTKNIYIYNIYIFKESKYIAGELTKNRMVHLKSIRIGIEESEDLSG